MNFTIRSNISSRIRAIQANIRALPDQLPDLAETAAERSETEVLEIIGFEPPRSRFPYGEFPWTSEKQRVAVLLKLKGQRYDRRGKSPRGWHMFTLATSNGALVGVQNDDETAKFLHGRFDSVSPQQHFHHVIGWPTARANRDRLLDILLKHTKQVILDRGGALILGTP